MTDATKCTTHHHACDCREARVAELLKAAKAFQKHMESIVSLYFWHDIDEDVWNRFSEAIEKMEEEK